MELIRTKLVIPPHRAGCIPRPRLGRLLENATALILVQAPAGYGKTTLLADWARSRVAAAWIGLDESDDDPARLAAAVAEACGAGSPAAGGLLASLVDALASRPGFALVLDDAHHLRSRAALDLVATLGDRLPQGALLAIASRGGPDLPWARWRARSALVELGPRELRLEPVEAARVVARLGGPVLTHEEAALLDARAEGWAAGVTLAARALASRAQTGGRAGVSAWLRDVRAAHRWALDFLLDEVLSRRPEADQELLMRTSVLDRISADLAAALCEDPEARVRFETLAHDGLFLLPVDSRGEWFRYHSLFAEVLRLRLGRLRPGLEPRLRRLAAEALEVRGDLEAAVEQRLAVADSHDAARLVESVAEVMLARGEIHAFLSWTDRIPAEVLAERPGLLVRRALCLLLEGRPVAEVRAALGAVGSDRTADTIRALLALFRGDLADAEGWAAGASGLDGTAGAFARLVLAAVRRDTRGEAEARVLLEEVARGGSPFAAGMALTFLAALEARSGRPSAARVLAEQALELAVDAEGRRLPGAARSLATLGILALDRDELDEAERLLRESLALGESSSGALVACVHTNLARVRAARGEWNDADHLIERAREKARLFDLTDEDDRYVEMESARLALARGDLASARAWAVGRKGTLGPTLATDRASTYEALLVAQILVADHRESEALELLRALDDLAAISTRPLVRAEARLILAEALAGLGRERDALDAAAECLRLAAPVDLRRLVREAPPRARVLLARAAEAIGGEAAAWYRETASRLDAATSSPMPQGLSPREREVLPYLTADLTAREIGERLFVSEHTVKSHLKSIYAKLEVRSRAAAVTRARELGLLP